MWAETSVWKVTLNPAEGGYISIGASCYYQQKALCEDVKSIVLNLGRTPEVSTKDSISLPQICTETERTESV